MSRVVNEEYFPHFENKTLPRLPIPNLDDTLNKYLRSISALLIDENQVDRERAWQKTKEFVEEFRVNDGPVLDNLLRELDKRSPTSWLEGFWDSMYLEIRDPIPINVNPFFVFEDEPKQVSQIERATGLISASLVFFQKLRNNELEPDKERNTPLCMSQYGRIFGSVRIPGGTRDELLTFPTSKHITVMCKGHFYSFQVIDARGDILSADAIKSNLQQIHQQAHEIKDEPPVGVLTTEERRTWCNLRNRVITFDPNNERAFKAIERSLFLVCLDEDSPALEEFSRIMLHSDGKNRYFDKSIQLVVAANGRSGINMEHSGIDGHTVLRYSAEIISEMRQGGRESSFLKSVVKKLEFNLPPDVLTAIETASAKFARFCKTTQTKVMLFSHFGKNFITSRKLSPDAVVQLAYQLAYFRLYGKAGSTYESAQTKQFYHGRTECVRSVSPESVAFTHAFTNQPGWEKKYEALVAAVNAHVKQMGACKKNQGIDRHLSGMYWLARMRQYCISGAKIPDMYLDRSYSLLKTDLMSTSNCGNQALCLFGFGPVCEEGFGLGYIIRDDSIHVNITSFKKKAKKFAEALTQSLLDIRDVMEEAAKHNKPPVKAKL